VSLLRHLKHPSCGFRLGSEGEWLWTLTHDPLADDLGKPSGTGVQLASVFGARC
jgi:hypothetical protein